MCPDGDNGMAEAIIGPLPDDAVVVRGGVMNPPDLYVNAVTHFQNRGEYCLSVFSIPEMSADEIAHVMVNTCDVLRNNKIRESTVGALRAAGYDVVPSDYYGHADLRLFSEPSDEHWDRLVTLFAPPRRNPAR